MDYTFGPGSPNPTHEDIHTYVGGKFSPAGGFAVEGGVALAPKEYNMFTPEQRKALGIMDIAPKDQVGKVERYFGTPSSYSQFASNRPPTVASPTSGGAYAFGTGSNPAQMSTGVDYAAALNRGQAFSGVGNALASIGQSQIAQGAQSAAQGSNQALAMLTNRRPSALSMYLPPISGGFYG